MTKGTLVSSEGSYILNIACDCGSVLQDINIYPTRPPCEGCDTRSVFKLNNCYVLQFISYPFDTRLLSSSTGSFSRPVNSRNTNCFKFCNIGMKNNSDTFLYLHFTLFLDDASWIPCFDNGFGGSSALFELLGHSLTDWLKKRKILLLKFLGSFDHMIFLSKRSPALK